MKKSLESFANAKLPNKISKEGMKKVIGGRLICGCLDVENNFYPGPSGASYCLAMYEGEPWCIRR